MEELFVFTSCGNVRGDCTCYYHCEMVREFTVKEFVDYILKNKSGEWGYIGIDEGRTTFGNPNIEYTHGNYSNEKRFPPEILNKKVLGLSADGG